MRPRAKVTIESLLEVVYEKSIGTKMNDLDHCLEVVSRSRQSLRYIWRWISRKPLDIEALFQRTTNRKWHMGYRMVTWPLMSLEIETAFQRTANRKWHMEYQMVTWPIMSRDPRRCCETVRSAILATAWLLVNIISNAWNLVFSRPLLLPCFCSCSSFILVASSDSFLPRRTV